MIYRNIYLPPVEITVSSTETKRRIYSLGMYQKHRVCLRHDPAFGNCPATRTGYFPLPRNRNRIVEFLAIGLCYKYEISIGKYKITNLAKNHSIMITEQIKKEILDDLQSIDPAKVILFGSFASGNPTKDSDIDLYIVTKDNYIPQSYEDSFEVTKRIYMALKNFRKEYASDIIVHTLPVHQKFLEYESSFSKEIMKNGIVLI